ncbi:MAG: DUF3224 domain-containing protein [Pseudomonadales bacterium]
MASTATGTFKIDSWEENTLVEYEHGGKMTRATVKQSYSGDIEGSSDIEYLMLHNASGSAKFVGYETIQCSLAGKQGSFVLQHDGEFSIGIASSSYRVASGSGRGGFMNISGDGRFSSMTGGEAEYSFEYQADSSDDQAGS